MWGEAEERRGDEERGEEWRRDERGVKEMRRGERSGGEMREEWRRGVEERELSHSYFKKCVSITHFCSLSFKSKTTSSERKNFFTNKWIFMRILVFPSPFTDSILQNSHKSRGMETQLLTGFYVSLKQFV